MKPQYVYKARTEDKGKVTHSVTLRFYERDAAILKKFDAVGVKRQKPYRYSRMAAIREAMLQYAAQ